MKKKLKNKTKTKPQNQRKIKGPSAAVWRRDWGGRRGEGTTRRPDGVKEGQQECRQEITVPQSSLQLGS